MSDPRSGGFFAISKNAGLTTVYHNGQSVGRYEEQPQPPLRQERRARTLDPSRLRGSKLKIERAKRHIEEFEALATAFAAREAYQLVHDIDPQTGENVFRVLVKEVIPTEASAIVGDAIHNIRCALDYLVCDLVRANNEVPHQNGGFPIDARAKRSEPGTIHKINGVSSTAERIILRIKACDGLNRQLFALNMLDVFDKHNAIVTVAAATIQITAQVGVQGIFLSPEGSLCFGGGGEPMMMDAGTPSQFRVICPLQNNIEVHRSPPGFNEELQAYIAIAFGKTEVLQIEGQPIIETLRAFTNLVERLIEVFECSCF